MKHYSHLTQEQRYQISAFLQAEKSYSFIANAVGCNKSTISRELKRNTGKRGYRPKQAHKFTQSRQSNNGLKITDFAWAYVDYLIRIYLSPEQISGRLKELGWQNVPCAESIYQSIYKNKALGGDLHTFLRCQKQRKKRYGSGQDRRGQIKNRIDIDERSIHANNRERIGDIEGDAVIGKNHKGILVTLVDRLTREVKIKALPNRKANLVTKACIDQLKNEQSLETITFDNGKEFALHEEIANALDVNIYFAKPYRSWERGSNENMNGLIRQFLPKNRRLDDVTAEEIAAIMTNLNNRSRKILGYLASLEIKSRNGVVAL